MTLEDSRSSFNVKVASGATSVSEFNSHVVSQAAFEFLRGRDENSNHEASKHHLLIIDKYERGGADEIKNNPHSESSTESVNEEEEVHRAESTQIQPNHRQVGSMIAAGSQSAIQMINGSSQKNESSRNMPTMIHPPRLGSEMSAVEVITASKGSNSKHEDPDIVHRMGVDVFVWGLNEGGQLGMLTSKSALIPRQIIEVPFTPVKVACGAEHSIFLSTTGEIWGLGQNKYGQLGLGLRGVPQVHELVRIEVGERRVTNIACGANHTVIQLDDGELFGSGNNKNGQLGLKENNIESFTPIKLPSGCIVSSFSCGDENTFVLDQASQKLYECTKEGVKRINLSDDLSQHTMTTVKCGANSTLILTQAGIVFSRTRGGQPHSQFIKLYSLANVKEIDACQENFAALTYSNKIYTWKEGADQPFRALEHGLLNTVNLVSISTGTDFGHAVDSDCNLYGWGNNKNGELGTGDSYPRQKLSQIRIFNTAQQYMRCVKVFNGHSFSVGLFESYNSGSRQQNYSGSAAGLLSMRSKSVGANPNAQNIPVGNSIQSSMYHTQNIKLGEMVTQNQRSNFSTLSPRAQRMQQYEQTEAAIQKYREQSLNFKENAKQLGISKNNSDKKPPINKRSSVNQAPIHTISFQDTFEHKQSRDESNDRSHIENKYKNIEDQIGQTQSLLMRSKQTKEAIAMHAQNNVVATTTQSDIQESVYTDRSRPNGTNINTYRQSNHNLKSSEHSNYNQPPMMSIPLSGGMQETIELTSSYITSLDKSKPSDSIKSRPFQNTNEFKQQNLKFPTPVNYTYTNTNMNSIMPSTNYLLSNSYSKEDVSVIKDKSRSKSQRREVSDNTRDREISKEKMNTYKRKLKKYISKNQSLVKELNSVKETMVNLQKQNNRLLRSQKNDEERVEALMEADHKRLQEVQSLMMKERKEKQKTINMLTQENQKLLQEIEERDQRHEQLEKRQEFVEDQVHEITEQLQQVTHQKAQLEEQNQYLLYQLQNKPDRDYTPTERSQIVDPALIDDLYLQIHRLQNELNKKDEQLMIRQGEINVLMKKNKHIKRQSQNLEVTVKDLQSRLEQNEQSKQNMRLNLKALKQQQMIQKGFEKMSTIDEDRQDTGISAREHDYQAYDQQELLMQNYDVYSTEQSNRAQIKQFKQANRYANLENFTKRSEPVQHQVRQRNQHLVNAQSANSVQVQNQNSITLTKSPVMTEQTNNTIKVNFDYGNEVVLRSREKLQHSSDLQSQQPKHNFSLNKFVDDSVTLEDLHLMQQNQSQNLSSYNQYHRQPNQSRSKSNPLRNPNNFIPVNPHMSYESQITNEFQSYHQQPLLNNSNIHQSFQNQTGQWSQASHQQQVPSQFATQSSRNNQNLNYGPVYFNPHARSFQHNHELSIDRNLLQTPQSIAPMNHSHQQAWYPQQQQHVTLAPPPFSIHHSQQPSAQINFNGQVQPQPLHQLSMNNFAQQPQIFTSNLPSSFNGTLLNPLTNRQVVSSQMLPNQGTSNFTDGGLPRVVSELSYQPGLNLDRRQTLPPFGELAQQIQHQNKAEREPNHKNDFSIDRLSNSQKKLAYDMLRDHMRNSMSRSSERMEISPNPALKQTSQKEQLISQRIGLVNQNSLSGASSPVVSYKDQLLNRVAKKINNEVNKSSERKEAIVLENHAKPVVERNLKTINQATNESSVIDKITPKNLNESKMSLPPNTPEQLQNKSVREINDMPPRPNFGQLRSVDRLSDLVKKRKMEKQALEEYNAVRKSWEQRRGRSESSNKEPITHEQLQKQYRDAFRTLSQEIKKKQAETKDVYTQEEFNTRYINQDHK